VTAAAQSGMKEWPQGEWCYERQRHSCVIGMLNLGRRRSKARGGWMCRRPSDWSSRWGAYWNGTLVTRNYGLFKTDLFVFHQKDEDIDQWFGGGDCAGWF
jgi:hypothetical protein